jgi:ubiquinone/menaquinone biosynthesis C-methylase UbiE
VKKTAVASEDGVSISHHFGRSRCFLVFEVEDTPSYFDQSADTWDGEPRRIALMKAVGEAILRETQPTKDMDVLDYGCGTGLVGLFLLPYVRSVTGADSSTGMLDVLRKKIMEGGINNMKAIRLDLEHDPAPKGRYDRIVTSMVLHHTADTRKVLTAFYEMLAPGGALCIADLDTEPGIFHTPDAAASVHHHGFDRTELKAELARIGFKETRDVTAHTIRKPVEGGSEREFPVFLVTAGR